MSTTHHVIHYPTAYMKSHRLLVAHIAVRDCVLVCAIVDIYTAKAVRDGNETRDGTTSGLCCIHMSAAVRLAVCSIVHLMHTSHISYRFIVCSPAVGCVMPHRINSRHLLHAHI